jgi:peroxiredoxin
VRDGLKAGTYAPDFTLPTLDGSKLSLQDFRGRKVLLVFSDPECGPCSAVAPELERIHQANNGVQVLMISRGDLSANQRKAAEQRLTFPIVLQKHWEISRAYGMFATPIAYVIDEAGVIASDVAVGAEPILRLAI